MAHLGATRVLSIGDLVRSLYLQDADDVARDQQDAAEVARVHILALFGVSLPQIKKPTESGPIVGHKPDDGPQPTRPGEVPPPAETAPPQLAYKPQTEEQDWRPQRLGDQPADDLPPEDETEASASRGENEAPALSDIANLFAATEAVAKEFAPLLDPRQSRSILRELVATRQPSSRPDLAPVLAALSRAAPPPDHVVRARVLRPARRIVVALDGADRMSLFFADAQHVQGRLKAQTNAEVELRTFAALHETLKPPAAAGAAQPRPPGPGDALLFLSDFGMGGWRGGDDWRIPAPRPLAQAVAALRTIGVTVSALAPMARRDIERRRVPGLAALAWDRSSRASDARRCVAEAARPGHRPMSAAADPPDARLVRRLALACLFFVRVTPARLRAARLGMLPALTADQEAKTWYGPDVLRLSSTLAAILPSHLDHERHRMIGWSQLYRILDRIGFVKAFAGLASDCRDWGAPADAANPPGVPDHERLAMEGYAARDWGAARAALAKIWRAPSLRQRLFDELGNLREGWFAELEALAAGQGAVIAEQAYELACAHAGRQPHESFERQLLWRLYWDEVHPRQGESRADAWLGYLFDSTKNPQGFEAEKGLDWVRFRLPHQAAGVRARRVAHKLAELAKEQLGVEVNLTMDTGRSPGLGDNVANRSAFDPDDFESRDLYALAADRGWRLSLDVFPLGPAESAASGLRALRMRVPNLPQQTLSLRYVDQETGALQERRLSLRAGERIFWDSPLGDAAGTLTTITGARYNFADAAQLDAFPPEFWRSHFRRARTKRDWVAQGRFARRWASAAALRARPFAPRFHALAAAAITEEAVDQADSDAHELAAAGGGGGARWRRVLALYYRLNYAEIDSRLADAAAHGESALAELGELSGAAATTWRLRILAALLRLQLRRIDIRTARSTLRRLGEGLRRSESERPCAALTQSRLEAQGALLAYGLQRGWPQWASERLRRAIEAVDPGRNELLVCLRATALAAHASYYLPADAYFDLMARAHDSARAVNREDLVLRGSADFCRVLFNAGQTKRAQDFAEKLWQIADRRRSAYRAANLLDEQAYQLSHNNKPGYALYAERALSILPPEEEGLINVVCVVSDAYVLVQAARAKKPPAQFLTELIDAARDGGSRMRELFLANKFFELEESDYRAHAPRFIFLARALGKNLNSANAYSNLASRDNDAREALNSQKLKDSKGEPGPLFGEEETSQHFARAIEIVDILQVSRSVVLYTFNWARHLVQTGQAERALAVIDDARRIAERQVTSPDYRDLLDVAEGEVRHALGQLDAAKELLGKCVTAGELPAYIKVRASAVSVLARIAADRGDWVEALDHLNTLSSHQLEWGPEYGTMFVLPAKNTAGILLLDLIDGRAFRAYEEGQTAAPSAAGLDFESDDPTFLFVERARNRRLAREHKIRETRWIQSLQRAAALMYAYYAVVEIGSPGKPPIPANDYWYVAENLNRRDIVEAAWFFRRAIEIADQTEELRVQIRESLAEKLNAIENRQEPPPLPTQLWQIPGEGAELT